MSTASPRPSTPSSSPPPRKRVRRHAAAGGGHNMENPPDYSSEVDSPTPSSHHHHHHHHHHHQQSLKATPRTQSSAYNNNSPPPSGRTGLSTTTTTSCSSSSSSTTSSDEDDESRDSSLLRKIPRRNGVLDKTNQEVVRLIGQHLTNIGLKTSANVLMEEAGIRLDQPTAATFRKHVLLGNWTEAVKTLDDLKPHLENPETLSEMKFLLLEQKYLEQLSTGNFIEALKVLQSELTPLCHNRERTHVLSSYLMLSNPEELSQVTTTCRPSTRADLMDRLQSFLPASIMLPPHRLTTLLAQAAEYQIDRCLYHNKSPPNRVLENDIEPMCLPSDHQCSKKDFPCETIQVLSDHCDEVWYCRFSPNGLKLATGSKDNTVIIWDFDPITLKLKHNKTLEGHNYGVSYFAWSPDSTRLAVCGPEESEEVRIWNVTSGKLDGKISRVNEDSLTTVSWSPDGKKIACGGSKGQFYQCDTKGTVQDSWEGVRVQCLAFRSNGKNILAADTHHRIRCYNFEELTDYTVLEEDQGIMTFSLDADDKHALLNIATQGIHMWDIDQKCLVRKFVGITQGFYTIHSCFGGFNQNFVASGSEDNKVYIFHVKRSNPIAVLPGHSRTVTCVSWNPVYPEVLVSASDDHTVRVWGPEQKYRKHLSNGNKLSSNSSLSSEISEGMSHSNNGIC